MHQAVVLLFGDSCCYNSSKLLQLDVLQLTYYQHRNVHCHTEAWRLIGDTTNTGYHQ